MSRFTKAERWLIRAHLALIAGVYYLEIYTRYFLFRQGWKVRVYTLTDDLRRRVYVRDLPHLFRTYNDADLYAQKIRAQYPGDFRFLLYPNW